MLVDDTTALAYSLAETIGRAFDRPSAMIAPAVRRFPPLQCPYRDAEYLTRSRATSTVFHRLFNRILDFEIYSNGVQIEKDAGVSPFLETSADMELLGLLLCRAIHDVM